MTAEESKIAIALSRCTFLPGSWDKRFARDIAESSGGLTDKQRTSLLRLANKYRRQLDTEIVVLAADEIEKLFSPQATL